MKKEQLSRNRLTRKETSKLISKLEKARSKQMRARRGAAKGIIIALLAVTAVGAGGYYWWSQRAASAMASSEKPVLDLISRGPFDHIVLEQGEIESSSNNEVKCEVKGNGGSGTPILNVIQEGTFVKKGDILCELDASALETEAKNQRIVVSTAESTVISSEAAVSKAEISRQEYLEGTYLTERNVILSEIVLGQQELRKAELSLQSAERLAAKGTLKPLQIEAEQFAVQNARNVLDSAQSRLRVLDELTKAKMLVQLDSDIATAKAKLDSDRNTLQEEKSKLAEIEAQIRACQVKAPMDGQVVYANKQGNRGGADFVVEPGSVVREQQTIFLLPDPTKMQVRAKVNESRITLIQEGMKVKIRVGAVDGELNGKVIKVNKYAEPGNWWGSNVKEYAVFVQITDPPETIRTGMTAEVRIFVEQIPDATQIPILAVYESKGHHFVLVQDGNKFLTKPIKVRAANEKFVTVKEGEVNVGEQVVLNPRNHLEKLDIPNLPGEPDETIPGLANEGDSESKNFEGSTLVRSASGNPDGPSQGREARPDASQGPPTGGPGGAGRPGAPGPGATGTGAPNGPAPSGRPGSGTSAAGTIGGGNSAAAAGGR